jgi:hypothetical protein
MIDFGTMRPKSIEMINKIIELLKEKPMTLIEIENLCKNTPVKSLQRHITKLKQANKIHVVEYVEQYNKKGDLLKYGHSAMYALSDGNNLPKKVKPLRLTSFESQIKVNQYPAASLPFPRNTDPLMHALFGMI